MAATPHMVAATVMALARLMYEFAGPLEYMVDDLLPAVLALLRTKSREIVKSVLGFVKVGPPPYVHLLNLSIIFRVSAWSIRQTAHVKQQTNKQQINSQPDRQTDRQTNNTMATRHNGNQTQPYPHQTWTLALYNGWPTSC